jgi:hypothetical protein
VDFHVNSSNYFLSRRVTSFLCTVILNYLYLQHTFQLNLIYWKNKRYFFTIKSHILRHRVSSNCVSHKNIEIGYYAIVRIFPLLPSVRCHTLHYYYCYYVVIFVIPINQLFLDCVPVLERSFPRFSTSVLQRMSNQVKYGVWEE